MASTIGVTTEQMLEAAMRVRPVEQGEFWAILQYVEPEPPKVDLSELALEKDEWL